MSRLLVSALLSFIASASLSASTASQRAVELRNQGIAQLENEAPTKAEETFRSLIQLLPKERLGHANLAIALLRQQKLEEARSAIGVALDRNPDDARLIAVEAEILHWSGDNESALAGFRRAADLAPSNVDLQYSLYRQATTTGAEGAAESAQIALERLARLRPENLVVLLQLGQRSRADDDRAGATAAYLRIRELMWQAPPGAEKLLADILEGLESGETDSLRGPALRLENVLKITPMYREGLRELSSGIQGIPLTRLEDEPATSDWGSPAPVHFTPRRLASRANAGTALATGDLDGDAKPEIARLSTSDEGVRLEILTAGEEAEPATYAAPDAERLLIADLDNDGALDVIAHGPRGVAVWRGAAGGGLGVATSDFGLDDARGTAAAVIDFDIEGDLDLLLAGVDVALFRNALDGPLDNVAAKSLPDAKLPAIADALAGDLDRDGDLDILLAHADGLSWLDNLRQGRFADRSSALPAVDGVRRVATADLDNDGLPDLVTLGDSLQLWRNAGGGFEPWKMAAMTSSARFSSLAIFDADNDGRLDIALGGTDGVSILGQRQGAFELLPPIATPSRVTVLAARDLDGDGDQDLLADGAKGLYLLDNDGGSGNRFLTVRLRGLDTGNSKNNVFGIGSTVEVRAGAAYQFREATGDVVHFGLGSVARPDLVRVVWTNGVPQNRLQPGVDQRIVEEQQLKGSCPFLYARGNDGFDFVTDLLWGAPIGLPIGDGAYLPADPQELVKIEGFSPHNGRYEIRITEELWEAAFFDYLRLWVVDHPDEVEVASSLRIQPGETVPEEVVGSRRLRPVVAVTDARGSDATERVRARDEIYADGWTRSAYQGVAAEPWSLGFDLGLAPAAPVRLHLDGWIFPTDASLNLALAQRSAPVPLPPRLEMLTVDGWQPLVPAMGFPAGKTKTMVVDTPPLPPEVSRLRIVSGQWLSWDRIAWSSDPADDEPVVVARLAAQTAELRYRGFSAPVRKAPNAPHTFDYQRVSSDSPWLAFPGRYTRYGDVRELLEGPDDRSAVLGPGDEMAIVFTATELPPLRSGWRRTVFLESHGWDKDADRNTGAGLQVEPLPFRAMQTYPYEHPEAFPDTPLHRDYLESWQTRIVTDRHDGRSRATIAHGMALPPRDPAGSSNGR